VGSGGGNYGLGDYLDEVDGNRAARDTGAPAGNRSGQERGPGIQ
jgi:hypothetical protein